MLKNAIEEMTRYKRLPILTPWAWKWLASLAAVAVALVTIG